MSWTARVRGGSLGVSEEEVGVLGCQRSGWKSWAARGVGVSLGLPKEWLGDLDCQSKGRESWAARGVRCGSLGLLE